MTGGMMRDADSFTINSIGTPALILMEHAALAIMDAAVHEANRNSRILAVSGSGNNGGDVVAAARLLMQKGYCTEVFFACERDRTSELNRLQTTIYQNLGGCIKFLDEFADIELLHEYMNSYDLILDGLFGTGMSRPADEIMQQVIGSINESSARIIAADIPSGINSTDGSIMGAAVEADTTVAIQYMKLGHLLYPGADHCGHIITADIGIRREESMRPAALSLTDADIRAMLPGRRRRSNKGTYGKALIAAGGPGMAGAAVLASSAALRSGLGLCICATSVVNRSVIQTRVPEAVYKSWEDAAILEETILSCDAVAAGPGLGMGEEARAVLDLILKKTVCPLVLDADALNILSEYSPDELRRLAGEKRRPVIITPHPGEMSRLTGKSVKEILADPMKTAAEYASLTGFIVLLKDASTIITDGQKFYINHNGCDGMATGGSGDVLTGIICSLLAQGMDALSAAACGAYLHGAAGNLAARDRSNRGMTSIDLEEHIPEVFKYLGEDIYGEEKQSGMCSC